MEMGYLDDRKRPTACTGPRKFSPHGLFLRGRASAGPPPDLHPQALTQV
jgi:hypothetical protein